MVEVKSNLLVRCLVIVSILVFSGVLSLFAVGGEMAYDNVALNSGIETSSYLSNQYEGSNMVDGNPATSWVSDNRQNEEWIVVDLRQVTPINGIGINWDEKHYAVEFSVATSLDGKNWKELFGGENGEGEFVKFMKIRKNEGFTAQFIRIVCTKKNPDTDLYGIKELEVYYVREFITPTPIPTPTLVNIALKKPVKASSILNESYAEHYLVDNLKDTVWGSKATADAQWLYIDLEAIEEVNGIGLFWYNKEYAALYDVYCSNDASKWQYLAGLSKTAPGDDVFTDKVSFKCRYLGFYFKKRNSEFIGLRELAVYQWKAAMNRSATTTVVYENIAAGMPAYESSYYNNDPVYVGDKAVDGTGTSAWKSEAGDVRPWLFIDMGKVVEVDGAGINWFDMFYAQTYNIGVSYDGSKWYTKYIVKSNEPDSINIFHASVSFRYIGVQCLTNEGGGGSYGIRELEVLRQVK